MRLRALDDHSSWSTAPGDSEFNQHELTITEIVLIIFKNGGADVEKPQDPVIAKAVSALMRQVHHHHQQHHQHRHQHHCHHHHRTASDLKAAICDLDLKGD